MRIVVDYDKCQTHGQCVMAAPEVFAIDAEGWQQVLQERPDESLRDKVEAAVDACPTQAITLLED